LAGFKSEDAAIRREANMSHEDEEVVMTPLRAKTQEVTLIKAERMHKGDFDRNSVKHIAGGPYEGIIIKKPGDDKPEDKEPDSCRDFIAYVTDPKNKEDEKFRKEKRVLRFWFHSGVDNKDAKVDKFWEDLMDPDNFPKGSIHYVKRILNLMKEYPGLAKVEMEMRPVERGEDNESNKPVRKHVTSLLLTKEIRVMHGHPSPDDTQNAGEASSPTIKEEDDSSSGMSDLLPIKTHIMLSHALDVV